MIQHHSIIVDVIKMFGFYFQFLLAIACIFYTLPTGSSIECYACDTLDDEDCDDPFNTTLYTPDNCENENFACVKQHKINKEQNRTYLHRGCIQKHYCEILAKAADFCITCTTNLCNSSSLTLGSVFVLSSALIKYVI